MEYTHKLWARVGVSIPVTEEEWRELGRLSAVWADDDRDDASGTFAEKFWEYYDRKHYADGDCYLPDFFDSGCNPNQYEIEV